MPMTLPDTAAQRRESPMAIDDSLAASEDLLFEFFDFFDKTIDDVYAYIEHRTRVSGIADDITLKLYFSLLQRRRFFWWRNVVKVSELFSMADKAIAGVVQWQEAAAGDSYVQQIAQFMPGANREEMLGKAHLVLGALKKLPLQDQKIAVIRFFLRWPAKKTAEVFSIEKNAVENAYAHSLTNYLAQLEKEEAFQNQNVESILQRIHCQSLSNTKKEELRVAILEKFRSAQMSSLRYVMPLAAFLLVATTVAGGAIGTMTVEPISASRSLHRVAAAQVILLVKNREYRDTLIRAEEGSRRIAASFAEKELAMISFDLAKPALAEQIAVEQEVYSTLRQLSEDALISRTWKKFVASIW